MAPLESTKSPDAAAILQLPIEMIDEICGRLDGLSLVSLAMTCWSLHNILVDRAGKQAQLALDDDDFDIKVSVGDLVGKSLSNSKETDHRLCRTCRVIHPFDHTSLMKLEPGVHSVKKGQKSSGSAKFDPFRPHRRIYDDYANLPSELQAWNQSLPLPKHKQDDPRQLRSNAEWRQKIMGYLTHPDDLTQPTVMVVRHTLADPTSSASVLRMALDYTNHLLCRHVGTGEAAVIRMGALFGGGDDVESPERYLPFSDPCGSSSPFHHRPRKYTLCGYCTTVFACSIENRDSGWEVTVDAFYKLSICVPMNSTLPPSLRGRGFEKWVWAIRWGHVPDNIPHELQGLQKRGFWWRASKLEEHLRIWEEKEASVQRRWHARKNPAAPVRRWWRKKELEGAMWSGCPSLDPAKI